MKRFLLTAIIALGTLTMSASYRTTPDGRELMWYNGHDPVTYQVQGRVSPVV